MTTEETEALLKSLRDQLDTLVKNQDSSFFWAYFREKERADRNQRLLDDKLTPKEVGRAHHIADLEENNKALKREVRAMQKKAEEFNNMLYAIGLIVHCTGCIEGGPFDYQNLTEDKVKEVERIARRLRTWWDGNKNRIPEKDQT